MHERSEGYRAENEGNLQAALAYCVRDWHVFPLYEIAADGRCACGDLDCGSPGKHPRVSRGLHDATTDHEQIRRWSARWPRANVAIRTGRESGLVVLDTDPRHDGMHSFEMVEDLLGTALPETVTSITGGGGTHGFYGYPEDGPRVPSVTALLPGLDVKADGGYVVAPPSLHESGRTYEWNPFLRPETTPLAPLPTALLAVIREPDLPQQVPTRAPRSLRDTAAARTAWEQLQRSPRIQRRYRRDSSGLHDTSESGVDYSLACQLAVCGFGEAEIRAAVEASRAEAGLPRKRESYYRATIVKALRSVA